MKVIINYNEITGEITDANGMFITNWIGLKYEKVADVSTGDSQIDGEQLIRMMKIVAHVDDADKIISI